MARDREDFEALIGLAEKAMFWLAWLVDRKLIFAARDDGMLVGLERIETVGHSNNQTT
ncbi:hypothetical protein [Serratia fonticola]|uniref:hypothetical protein n=1 Tax=Serratia fonticola TaxID=47917 RepID=UPI001AE867B1|nr:hypothetical protein [Serratia fonticola]MBP1034570.1 hypothetical protein [Serratia fonticola]